MPCKIMECVSIHSVSVVFELCSEASEVSLSEYSSDDVDSVSTLSIQPLVRHGSVPGHGIEVETWKNWRVTYHCCASIRRTHRAAIFSLSLTLIDGNNLYFSSSEMGKMLANQ